MFVGVNVGVYVPVLVGVLVSVFVLIGVLVLVDVCVGVLVWVGVGVNVNVDVDVDVKILGVCVTVGVLLGTSVGLGVSEGVLVGVTVKVGVFVLVGVIVGVRVTVKLGASVGEGHGTLAMRNPQPPRLPTSPFRIISRTTSVQIPPEGVRCSNAPSGEYEACPGGHAEPIWFDAWSSMPNPVFSNVQSGSLRHTLVKSVFSKFVGPIKNTLRSAGRV